MIEAWQLEHRPILYFFLRRFELVRWTLFGKDFHKDAKWYALPLALYLALTGYETERCLFCGWKVGCVWWCDSQETWATVTGWREGGGIACINCFVERAEQSGIYLRFTTEPLRKRTQEAEREQSELRDYTEAEWREMIAKDRSVVENPHAF